MVAVAASLALAGSAVASHPQPAPDISKLDYFPIGQYGPDGQAWVGGPTADRSETLPATNSPLAPTAGRRYNPSGKYVAYDTNLFEALTLPFRAAGDEAANDPPGNGGNPLFGFCQGGAPDPDGAAPLTALAGQCPNHQLEYLDYFEETMREILGPFGVTVKRYQFESPGGINTRSGRSFNVAAVVPGADHPEETVLVSGHYDQTTEAPASAWDSAEGHAEVIRMAKIMADYWTATGTRPSATIKFIPWDQEESGTLGSQDYVDNNVVPGEEAEVRGYFNVDPCGGAYPAFYRGNPGDRVPLVLQLVNPADHEDEAAFVARVNRFNARAETVVDEVFDRLDDKLMTTPGQPDIYVSNREAEASGGDSQRDEVQTALGGLLLFTSDYANFEAIGVPFFNLGPAFFGPSADGTPNRQDGIAILHTPNDNHRTLNALTSLDQTGSTVSEGWAKGMELCAQTESWYMLQPEMAGGQTASGNVVAYYEALPNEAIQNQAVTFSAAGSYRYTDVGARQLTDDLTYTWDFGDGTTATGKQVTHRYTEVGRYPSRLTVSNGADTDTMEVPITVVGSNFTPPELEALPPVDVDGSFPLEWTFEGTRDGLERFSIEESTNFRSLFSDNAEQGPGPKWDVNDPEEPTIEPWQASDSAARKARGNVRRSGERSFWTGVQPQNFQPAEVQQGESILTLKEPIEVPATGDSELAYWSLFQSESDDQGRVEVARAGPAGSELDWQPVDIIAAASGALGGPPDRAVCNPSEPGTLVNELESRRASLQPFKGRTIRVRFVYSLGTSNPVASQPCGWYVDDVRVQTGDFQQVGTAPPAARRFEVTGRTANLFAYRVAGVYNDGIRTAPSNIESVRVTAEARAGGGRVIVGTPGADTIVCTDKDDVVRAGGGNDVIRCGAGNDFVDGGAGNDRISGQAGNDRLLGSAGRDRAYGGTGRDRMSGGSGADRLLGRSGRDRIFGRQGADALSGDSGRDLVLGGSGRDRIFGRTGNDNLSGNSGGDRLSGGAGRDRLLGRKRNDRLYGGRGNDRLFGGPGNDRLFGGGGRDFLRGGPGRDRNRGGPGRDRSRR